MDIKVVAIQIAQKAFEGKTDKGGKPYIGHLERVSKKFIEDDFLYIIAILHDLLEDCPEWNEDSLSHLFPKIITDALVALKKEKNEDYFKYIDRVSQNIFAKRVKIEDLKDNMDITRLSALGNKDFSRLEKYHKAYHILTAKN